MLLFVLLALGHATQGLPNVDDVTIPPWVTTTTEASRSLGPVDLDVQLPRSIKPLHYVVKLQPFINGNFSIVGYMEVDMEVLKPTSNITLHISDIITKNDTVKVAAPLCGQTSTFINGNFSIVGYMEVEMEVLEPTSNITLHISDIITKNDTVKVSDQATSRGLRIKKHEYDHSRHFYIAHLRKELQKGKRYILSMEFLGYLNNKLHGFYRATYKDKCGCDPVPAHRRPQGLPLLRRAALKATFEIHLARESWMTTLSNMPIAETVPVEGQEGWMWDRYEKSVPMSTYLVAFVVSDYVHINSTENDRVDFRVWARQETIDQAEYANEIGPKILCFFEDYFNLSYPLPKMDMIALTDLSFGGMENWGLITFRESLLLYDPQVSTPADKAVIAKIVSHELAHQWFGNLVTPKWWDDLWLNEGFATYISYLGVDHVEPTWKAMEEIVVEIVHRVFNLDSLESSHRINIPVSNPDEIFEVFDDISYNKDDLWKHLTLAAHEDGILPQDVTVKMIMDTWTLQMGYPVVKERFLLEGSANSQHHGLQVRGQLQQTQASLWMKDSEDHVTVSSLPPKDQWVIFNLQQAAYYRVNYDDQLESYHPAAEEGPPGHLSYKLALDVLPYLRNEGEYLPWATGARKFVYIESMFRRRSGFGALKVRLGGSHGVLLACDETATDMPNSLPLDLVLPLYESVGFDNNIEDSFLEQKRGK
ncbi:putative Aminopeptidase N precursor [Penaeus vannamei]|uniref:Putative Aminopeptidase N n=1 Tax=Penaeus vannamei TaxID=6689 RepID=A0A3R7QJ33_PENVA|nr:putative Aminopeptidase N precursor [Penaeus vannamei]